MNTPEKILITILSGNLFVNIIFSAITTKLLLDIWGQYGHFIAIAIITPFIIIFCEISPKVISMNLYKSISIIVIPFLKIFHFLFMPIRELLLSITNTIIKILNLKLKDPKKISEEELDMAIKIGEEERLIDKKEKSFMQNVLRFSKKEASNVMIPRNRAVFIPYNSTIEEAVTIFLNEKIVRAPVFNKDLDDIIGILDSRELIPYSLGYKKAKTIKKFIHETYHYPASKELGDLLSDFLSKKIQIAILVDEYGGTAGVVTLASIISELMGKKFIFEDRDYKPELTKIDDKTYIISGDMQIDDFNFILNEYLESKDSETIGGYIIEKLGYFPKKGEKFLTNKYILKVNHIRKNSIVTIELVSKDNNVIYNNS